MNAGRELDALVAEKVMGWEVYQDTPGTWMRVIDGMTDYSIEYDIPYFSTDIAAAWEVVERFCDDRAVMFEIAYDAKGWHVDTASAQGPGACLVAETASLAICLGILRAYGIEIDRPKDIQ